MSRSAVELVARTALLLAALSSLGVLAWVLDRGPCRASAGGPVPSPAGCRVEHGMPRSRTTLVAPFRSRRFVSAATLATLGVVTIVAVAQVPEVTQVADPDEVWPLAFASALGLHFSLWAGVPMLRRVHDHRRRRTVEAQVVGRHVEAEDDPAVTGRSDLLPAVTVHRLDLSIVGVERATRCLAVRAEVAASVEVGQRVHVTFSPRCGYVYDVAPVTLAGITAVA